MKKGRIKKRGKNPRRIVKPVKFPFKAPVEEPIPVEIPQRVEVAR